MMLDLLDLFVQWLVTVVCSKPLKVWLPLIS